MLRSIDFPFILLTELTYFFYIKFDKHTSNNTRIIQLFCSIELSFDKYRIQFRHEISTWALNNTKHEIVKYKSKSQHLYQFLTQIQSDENHCDDSKSSAVKIKNLN